MQRIKTRLSRITKFNNLYKACTCFTFLGFFIIGLSVIIGLAELAHIHLLPSMFDDWCYMADYCYSTCGIIAAIALLSHTTLTVLISTSENKTFGIELKEFLKKCKWRLRPLSIFGLSVLAVLASIILALCERPGLIFIILFWLILYVGCYSLIVWKLIINTSFAADFFKKFFEKTDKTSMLEEKKQIIEKILNQFTILDKGEQKYGIDIIENLLESPNQELLDFYKVTVQNTFHQSVEKGIDLDENVFKDLCDRIPYEEFSYCTLLIDTYSAVKNTNKESKEKCLLLKKIKSIICKDPRYKEIADFFLVNRINEKQDDEYIKQFLRNSFTANLEQGFLYASKELSRDAASMGIDDEGIKNIFIEIYKRLQSASPEYFGKYEMGRHFSEFRDVFFSREKERKYYTPELGWEIAYNYIKSLVTNTSLFTEKQCKMITAFVASGIEPFSSQWKDEYIPITQYEDFLRKVLICCESQIITLGEGEKTRKMLLEAILIPVNRYEKVSSDMYNKIYRDFFIVLGEASKSEVLRKTEVKDIMKYDIGPKACKLRSVMKREWNGFKSKKDCRLHNEVMRYLGKSGITESELSEIEHELEKFKRIF